MATMTPRLLKSILLRAQEELDEGDVAKARMNMRDYFKWSTEVPYVAENAALARRIDKRIRAHDIADSWRREMKRLLDARDGIIKRTQPEDRKRVAVKWQAAFKSASDSAAAAEKEARAGL